MRSLILLLSLVATQAAEHYDVVVVGATPAGVAAAYNAAREGATTVLVEETIHIGGLASGGLSNTDLRDFESVGGTFQEFMRRVQSDYADRYGTDSQQVKDSVLGGYYEPGVARRVFERMLAEQKVNVLKFHRLTAVGKQGSRLSSATFQDVRGGGNRTISGGVFIDATYEGDLMARADVPYHLGCEAKAKYGESLAPDEENKWVQTFNFRVCLTRDPANSMGLPKPKGYRAGDFAQLAQELREGKVTSFANPDPNPALKVRPIPNNKADFNDIPNAFSLAVENINHPWVEGDPAVRKDIFDQYKRHSLGLFYFLANDPQVPETIRRSMKQWGIPKDEYRDSDNWTPALYVREGRRMIGDFVFTEHHTQPAAGSLRGPMQTDSVAVGFYSLN
ncbi:MAG: FAD-dependent oxidoreductase, partial [Bryobacteraceae bacterium]|nr:FAD-dependent oxidoreductase [Bryobacteraceae bacterium]